MSAPRGGGTPASPAAPAAPNPVRRVLDAARQGPPWLLVAVGVLCVGLGAYLAVRPMDSLAALVLFVALAMIISGAGDILEDRDDPSPLPAAVGALWILGGLVLLVAPGLTLRSLALIVGIALIVSGLARLVGGLRVGTIDARAAAVLAGVAGIVFGLLALAWPDISTVVIAVLFGARTVWFGLTLIWGALRRMVGRPGGDAASPPGLIRRWARLAGSAAALLLAIALAGVSSRLQAGVPVVDAFYNAPDSVPATPGVLLRSEAFTRNIPASAQAWRILYTTTRDDGVPAIASALVVAPASLSGPAPVINWAHGTTGFASACAPSVLADGFSAGAFFLLDQVIAHGWVLVATDYVGLGTPGPHPYLIGQGEGRSVLDASRAARQLPGVTLSDQNIVWGHSQGGNAALWTGVLAPSYAPDLKLAGVAALAPASDLVGLVSNLPKVIGGSLFASYVIGAYTATYPDVKLDAFVRPGAQPIVAQMEQRCLADPRVMASVLSALSLSKDPDIFATDPTTGAMGDRLRQNIPTGSIGAPLFIGQGEADSLVLRSVQDGYVAGRCQAGQALEYRTYPGRDHVPLVEADSPLVPDLISWTQDRLAGKAPVSTCGG